LSVRNFSSFSLFGNQPEREREKEEENEEKQKQKGRRRKRREKWHFSINNHYNQTTTKAPSFNSASLR